MAITSGRHPYQVAVHIAALAGGLTLVLADRVPRSVAESMSRPVQVLWLVLLVLAGVAALVGAWWPGLVDTGLLVELGGVALLAGAALMYVIALFAAVGWQAVGPGAFMSGISAGSWWRAWQIVRDLRRLGGVDRGSR